jgi:hypothetical protein
MKVNQVVGEHKKGFKAKKYARKPKQYIEPVKPTAPQGPEEQRKQQIKEGMERVFGDWMNSEHAPTDDESGDSDAVFMKALHFLDGRTKRPDIEYFAHKLAHMYHGSGDPDDDVEMEEELPGQMVGKVSQVKPDGSVDIATPTGVKTVTATQLTPGTGNTLQMQMPKIIPGMDVKVAESLADIRKLSGL